MDGSICVGLLLGALAVVALLVAARRRLPSLLTLIAGFLGLGPQAEAGKPEPGPKREEQPDPALERVRSAAEWSGLVRAWARLNRIEAALEKLKDWGAKAKALKQISEEVRAETKGLKALGEKGLLGAEQARVLSALFEDRLSHLERSHSGRTCYRMTVEGGRRAAARADLEKQLDLLEEFLRKGTLSQATFDKARAAIAKNLARLGAASRCMGLVLELTRAAAKIEKL